MNLIMARTGARRRRARRFTDDGALAEWAGHRVSVFEGRDEQT